jgi:replicative DNA helicase
MTEQQSAERLPPFDEAAELAIIGSVLLAADRVLAEASWLPIDAFMLPHHREAWAAILEVASRRMPVDQLSVGDELRARGMHLRFPGGWLDWAMKAVSSVSVIDHVEHHARIVADKATLRGLLRMCSDVASAAYGDQPSADVLARAREAVAALEVAGPSSGPERVGTLIGGVVDVIQARHERKTAPGVPIHLGALADIITAWLPAKQYIVGGRPGDGKTSFVVEAALHAAFAGFPSLVFSREAIPQELIERNISTVSKVPAFYLASGRLSKAQWKCIQNAGEALRPAPLWYDDRSATIDQIIAVARKWHAIEVRGNKNARNVGPDGVPLGLLVLDYIQLARIAKVRAGMNREQVVAEISRAMKELALELKIPVIAASQLNREAEKRGDRPLPSDLRESGSLEQDADVILFVYRDVPVEDKAARREPGPAEIIVGKHRGGPTGIAKCWFETPLMSFRDVDGFVPPAADTRTESWNTKGDF